MQPLMTPIDTADGVFVNGNKLTGIKGTIATADWFNGAQAGIRDVQSELIAVLTAAGINPDAATAGQFYSALRKLFLSRTHPFADIKADGAAAIAEGLANLGLGDGTALPVGVPVPWPTATAPTGWLKCNGAAFTAAQYPKLAAVYPSLILPDLRGEFIRGWDNGRLVDSGRSILSAQGDAIRNIVGSINALGAESGAFYYSKTPSTGSWVHWAADTATHDVMAYGFDASRVVPTAAENRPRNIAFNYIVRAA